MTLTVTQPAELIFSMAVAKGAEFASERLLVSLDGAAVEAEELVDSHGTRLHRVEVGTGELEASYTATILGQTPEEELIPTDLIRYLRPSRYCESDSLAPTAAAEFQGLEGVDLLDAVSSWVGTRLWYVERIEPADGRRRADLPRTPGRLPRLRAPVRRTAAGTGTYPARLVSVYAPGLAPMDFHAVAEAYVDGAWHVVDATTLAPRSTMVRIATGRDASDTAFLTTQRGGVDFHSLEVTAVVDELPNDDVTALVRLG